METENKIFAFVGALIIVMGIVFLVWIANRTGQCDDACGIRRSAWIQDTCHCATETGWERPEDEP